MNRDDPQFEIFSNPAFCEYVRLLVQLHDLIRQDADESPNGEAIREQLDVCGEGLSQYGVETLKGLSADFYSLSDEVSTAIRSAPNPPAILKSAVEAYRSSEFARTLEILRANAADIDAARLAFLRGRVLSEGGLHDIGHRFFRLSAELEPENANYAFAKLDSLSKADFATAKKEAEIVLDRADDLPKSLVFKAAEIQFTSTRDMEPHTAIALLKNLIPVFEGLIVALESGDSANTPPRILSHAYLLCGYCFQEVGRIDDARLCFDQAVRLDPHDDLLRTSRGMLLYGRDTREALHDFEYAVAIGSQSIWPFLFLAHSYIIQGRYHACLGMCERSLRFPCTDKVRANCLEWIAICKAMLGYPADSVRMAFERALRLAPENSRIHENYDAFKSLLTENAQFEWNVESEDEMGKMAGNPYLFPLAA